MCVYTHTHTHTHVCVHTYTHTHTHTHTTPRCIYKHDVVPCSRISSQNVMHNKQSSLHTTISNQDEHEKDQELMLNLYCKLSQLARPCKISPQKASLPPHENTNVCKRPCTHSNSNAYLTITASLHPNTHKHTHTHTHTHTRTRAHTHTHTLVLVYLRHCLIQAMWSPLSRRQSQAEQLNWKLHWMWRGQLKPSCPNWHLWVKEIFTHPLARNTKLQGRMGLSTE